MSNTMSAMFGIKNLLKPFQGMGLDMAYLHWAMPNVFAVILSG